MVAGGTVSVCMPAHRDGEWFREALASVDAQTYPAVEVIVGDDSGGALREAARSVDAIYLSHESPLGFAGNHWSTIQAGSGEYVAFLHDDDAWHPEFLTEAVRVLEANPKVGVVIAGVDEVDGDGESLGPRPARMPAGVQADPLSLFLSRDFMLMLPSATVFRRAALKTNRKWRDVVAADITMYVDAAWDLWDVYHLPKQLVRYRTHPGQIGNDDLAHRDALVVVWANYRFTGAHERLRETRVAESLRARAGALVKSGETHQARLDLLVAGVHDIRVVGLRWLLVFALTLTPTALTRLVGRVRTSTYDAVRARHAG